MSEYTDLRDAQEKAQLARFKVLKNGCYRLDIPELEMTFEVDRLRWERHQLIGELTVRCSIPGASTVGDGVLNIAEMNFSSVRSREDRDRYLRRRLKTKEDVDWLALLEEVSVRVLDADRRGTPSIDLRTMPAPAPDTMLNVDGLTLPRRHPSILFGDGGAAKSYLGLYVLGCLANEGVRVALFDWELAGEDHRTRLEQLFGGLMPQIEYARCDRPLVSEVDRLRRIVREKGVEFAMFDSVAFACDGPPEAAEIAGRYFRATRQLGAIGSLHIAHVSKAEGADKKPFGSAFWHNGARSTWFAKLAEDDPQDDVIQVGLFHRKTNLGAKQRSIGFELAFSASRTTISRVSLADIPEFVTKMTVRQRMDQALKPGSMSVEKLAQAVDVSANTIRLTIRRNGVQFVLLEGGYVGRVRE